MTHISMPIISYNYNDKKISETEIFSWIEVNEKEVSCMIAGEGI